MHSSHLCPNAGDGAVAARTGKEVLPATIQVGSGNFLPPSPSLEVLEVQLQAMAPNLRPLGFSNQMHALVTSRSCLRAIEYLKCSTALGCSSGWHPKGMQVSSKIVLSISYAREYEMQASMEHRSSSHPRFVQMCFACRELRVSDSTDAGPRSKTCAGVPCASLP